MVDPSTVFIDGTHIKASANKKKFQKEQVRKTAKVYSGQLRREVNVIERFFNRLKELHRAETRYDKRDDSFLAFVMVAASCVAFSILHI